MGALLGAAHGMDSAGGVTGKGWLLEGLYSREQIEAEVDAMLSNAAVGGKEL